MGHPRCDGCPDCHTTLEEGPTQHTEPEPHTWSAPMWCIEPSTGERWQERECYTCRTRERVGAVISPEEAD